MKPLLLLIAALLLCGLSFTQMSSAYNVDQKHLEAESEVLYLPKQEAVELVSFGYTNLIGHLIWFNTISYFGKHYKTDGKYTWLYHMCDLVSSLNPKAKHVYNFCSTMLSWEGGSADKSIELLTKAIEANPKTWEYYYLRGFNYMYFLKQSELAQLDFQAGALLPEAPVFLTRLASKKLAQLDRPEEAIAFLNNMIQASEDPTQKQALRLRLEQIIDDLNVKTLEEGALIFKQQHGKFPKNLQQLVEAGIAAKITDDPWGSPYKIDAKTGLVSSDSPHRRLRKR